MEKQKLNIPSLRFPEYLDGWAITTLLDLSANGFSNGVFNDPNKVGEGYRIINVKDMYIDGSIDINKLTLVNIDEKEFIKNKVEHGDVFFTRSSIVKEGIAFSNVNLSFANDLTYDGHLIRMRPKKEKSLPSFLFYLLKTSKVRRSLVKKGKTTTMTTIGQEDLAVVEVDLPSLPEQQKIASFLTTVDEKLQALKKKKTLLEQYKKAVMQKIFSQEIRFKDDNGKEFPEWEINALGEVLIKNSLKNKNCEFTLVQSVSNKHGFVNQDVYFEDRIIASKDLSGYYVITKGTFAYNPSRIDVGSLAYKTDDSTSVVSPLYISFKTKDDISDLFLLNWFSSEEFIKQMNASFEGSVRNTLSYEALSKILISYPSIPEQSKIANFLSTIDEKLQHCQIQIDKTELWKKGLLQRMFC